MVVYRPVGETFGTCWMQAEVSSGSGRHFRDLPVKRKNKFALRENSAAGELRTA
jgi:hypothetical protein